MFVADIWDVTKQEEVQPTVAVVGKLTDSDNDGTAVASVIKLPLIRFKGWLLSAELKPLSLSPILLQAKE